ncbi:MAG TPA: GNVR domain-containing protein [Longimicrobiaceae bacterium]|nr:GNVR domain-containing protein [Longimicrobiaceae bacterium]
MTSARPTERYGREAAPGSTGSWLSIVRRRWVTGAAILCTTSALSAVVVLTAHPVWRAEATARIGAPPALGGVGAPQGGSSAGLFSLFQQMTGDPFSNELELLSSRTVIEGVVSDNALDVRVVAPRGWPRDSLLTHLSSVGRDEASSFEASWLESGLVHLRRTVPSDSLVGEFRPGEVASFGGLSAVFRPWHEGMPDQIEFRAMPFGEAVRQTAGKLASQRKRREANLVQLSYSSTDAGLALAVVRSASDRYAALRTELQRRESGQTSDSLRALADQTLAELQREEQALERFQREAGLIAPEAQSEAFVGRHTEVAGALERARIELARTDEVLLRVSEATDPASAWVGLVAHPTFLANPTLGDILTNLMGLEQQRLALRERRTAEDGGVRALDAQIALLDSSLRSLLRQYREGVADGIHLLEAQRAQLESMLARVPSDAIEMQRRERAIRQLSEVYLFTDQRLRQESLRNAISFASVQIIDPPDLLFKPVWPRKKLGLAIGVLCGLVFGALGMVVAERADRRIRGTYEAADLLGLPVLARISLAATENGSQAEARNGSPLLRPRAGETGTLVLVPIDGSAGAATLAAMMTDTRAANGVAGKTDRRHPPDRQPRPSDPDRSVGVGPIAGSARSGDATDPDSSPIATYPAALAAGPSAVGGRPETANGGQSRRPIVLGPVLDSYLAALDLRDQVEGGARIALVVHLGYTVREVALEAASLTRQAGLVPTGVIVVEGAPTPTERAG